METFERSTQEDLPYSTLKAVVSELAPAFEMIALDRYECSIFRPDQGSLRVTSLFRHLASVQLFQKYFVEL
jgi:hypothetical protein